MLLRKDDPWIRESSIPDIRNWRVVDAEDREIGFVESIAVDRPKGDVTAIFTGANERFLLSEVEIGDQVVRVKEARSKAPDRPSKRDGVRSFSTVYRRHFDDAYGRIGTYSFEELLPAYRFGRRKALDADFSGLSFESALEDLRGYWVSSKKRLPFEDALPAIRVGYESVRAGSEYANSGSEREDEKNLSPDRSYGGGLILRAGKPKRTGKPSWM